MKRIVIFLALMFAGFAIFLPVNKTEAAGPCLCILKDGSSADCRTGPCQYTDANCSFVSGAADAATACQTQAQQYNDSKRGSATTPTTPPPAAGESSSGGLQSKIIPKCALEDVLRDECKDVTIFLELMFNIINYLFGIIGSVALLFFIYGGFVFILSEGNAERVEHGKSIIMAAVLGIIIAFSGYALVKFVGSVIGINEEYRLDAPPPK